MRAEKKLEVTGKLYNHHTVPTMLAVWSGLTTVEAVIGETGF